MSRTIIKKDKISYIELNFVQQLINFLIVSN
jgi:hypothetical protein